MGINNIEFRIQDLEFGIKKLMYWSKGKRRRTADALGISAIISIMCVSVVLAAQPSAELREAAFDSLQRSYRAGRWEDVVHRIEQFRAKWPKSNRDAATTILLAEASLKLRQVETCELEARRLLVRFPESSLVSRAHLALGEAALIRGDWEEARRELGWVTGFSADTAAVRAAGMHLDELDSYLRSLESPPPPSPALQPKVSLILPFTGSEENVAKQYLRAFLWRWKRAGFTEPPVYDTEDDPVRAVRLFQNAVRRDGCEVAVGGLTPGEAVSLAAASTSLKTPFLSTYSGLTGLAAIGPEVIQGRPDLHRVGEALARYATEQLLLRHFAVIAPSESDAKQIADGFQEAAIESGAEIIASVSYYPGSIEFGPQLQQVREAALRRSFDDSLRFVFETSNAVMLDGMLYVPSGKDVQPSSATTVAESGAGAKTLSQAFLDSLWQDQYRRARRWMAATNREIDSLLIPTPTLDGVLMVIEPGVIEIAAPQLARYNLNRQLFGNEAWGNRELLRKVSGYVEGLIYADPLSGARDSTDMEFTRAMAECGDLTTTRAHYAGERAAAIIAGSFLTLDHRPFRDRMATLYKLNTLSGQVSFLREERVVRETPLYIVRNGEVITLSQ